MSIESYGCICVMSGFVSALSCVLFHAGLFAAVAVAVALVFGAMLLSTHVVRR